MPGRNDTGGRGIALIAVTYIYFLIFAQFAFLKRLAELGIADDHLKAVMGAMACGGILFSLLTPRVTVIAAPALRLRFGLTACGAAALLTTLPLSLPVSMGVSALIGCGLGLLTVTLVTHLRLWLGTGNLLFKTALGTGLGYLFCNIPPFFTASPETQAVVSAILCLAAIALARTTPTSPESASRTPTRAAFLPILAAFTALIWLDSAAFFIIQNNPALKAGTWQGTAHLLVNGFLHFAAALAAAWLLRRRGLSFVLSLAFAGFACACLLLLDPSRTLVASVFYPAAVSLYSVALVAYPALLAPAASDAERGRQAGWIYAIAGWFGSAMGIGMGQNLGYVPPAFVAAAGVAILLPELWRRRRRELGAVALTLAAAFCLDRALSRAPAAPTTSAERGRQVYFSEGCIGCHSQYVRPGTQDVLLWGPVLSTEEIEKQHPPPIGNRRQGPDLSQVGRRRSALWLKAHFFDPAGVSYASFMPSYEHLFEDTRGQDLIAYLQTLNSKEPHRAESEWTPVTASGEDGTRLFSLYCATCHTPAGATVTRWRTGFRRIPPDLRTGPFLHATRLNLARIVKFGIRATDMPGHEYLPDAQIAALAAHVVGEACGNLPPPGELRNEPNVLSLCN